MNSPEIRKGFQATFERTAEILEKNFWKSGYRIVAFLERAYRFGHYPVIKFPGRPQLVDRHYRLLPDSGRFKDKYANSASHAICGILIDTATACMCKYRLNVGELQSDMNIPNHYAECVCTGTIGIGVGYETIIERMKHFDMKIEFAKIEQQKDNGPIAGSTGSTRGKFEKWRKALGGMRDIAIQFSHDSKFFEIKPRRAAGFINKYEALFLYVLGEWEILWDNLELAKEAFAPGVDAVEIARKALDPADTRCVKDAEWLADHVGRFAGVDEGVELKIKSQNLLDIM